MYGHYQLGINLSVQLYLPLCWCNLTNPVDSLIKDLLQNQKGKITNKNVASRRSKHPMEGFAYEARVTMLIQFHLSDKSI